MRSELDLSVVHAFGTALLIGALIGLEREKRQLAEREPGVGGLRTFVIIALVGAISGSLSLALDSPWPLVAALFAVTAPLVAGYLLAARRSPQSLGLTTESAALAVCLLGAMTTLGHAPLAVAIAIALAAVLAYKQPLHGIVERIGWDDLFAGLRLLIATFIVLPLLPDRAVDPWEALNPYSLWLLVLLISGLSLVGYVGTRWLGASKGTALAGLMGGLVSSTAVTLSFARQSREERDRAACHALAGGMLLAWCIMFGRVIAEVLVVNRALVGRVLVPFAAMALAAAVPSWVFLRRSVGARESPAATAREVPLKNPFSLTSASKFAAFFAAVLVVVKLVQQHASGGGMLTVAALAGLTDVDAITLSMANYAKTGDVSIAVNSIVLAALVNTLVKCGMAVALGGPALRRPVALATGLVLLCGLAAVAWPVLFG